MWQLKCILPKILMVNWTEIGGLMLCLKRVYVCVLLLHFVEECRRKCVDIQYLKFQSVVNANGFNRCLKLILCKCNKKNSAKNQLN